MDTISKINRKSFLELLAGLSGTAVLAAKMPWFNVFTSPAEAGTGASDRVRIGFIGLGIRGRALLLNALDLSKRTNIDIVSVCDNYEPHYDLAVWLTEGKPQAFYDYREMLEKVPMDAVIIATPPHEHARMTIDAMKAGIHVFVEKSMARTLEDVRAMHDSWRETGKIMIVGYQRLFNPVYLQVMEMLERGDIGKIGMLRAWWTRNCDWVLYDVPDGRGSALDRRLNWRLYRKTSAGPISELGSHHFQIANWILGSEPLSVTGSGSINFHKDGREVHDNFSLVFRYPEGIHFSYDCLQSNKHNGVEFQVLGNKGTIHLESNKKFEEHPPPPPALIRMLNNIESRIFDTIPIGGPTWIPAEPVTAGGEYISPDYKLDDTQLCLEAFIQFVRKGEAPAKLTEEGYLASVWCLLAEEACLTGKAVTLPRRYSLSKI